MISLRFQLSILETILSSSGETLLLMSKVNVSLVTDAQLNISNIYGNCRRLWALI